MPRAPDGAQPISWFGSALAGCSYARHGLLRAATMLRSSDIVDGSVGPNETRGRTKTLDSMVFVKRHPLLRTWETPTFAHRACSFGDGFAFSEGVEFGAEGCFGSGCGAA